MNKNDHKDRIIWTFFTIILPIMFGAFFYFLFCEDVIITRYLKELLKIQSTIKMPRTKIFVFVRNNFLDGIWAFSFVNFFYVVFINNEKYFLLCSLIPLLFGILLEFLQYEKLIEGTGDLYDVIIEAVGSIIALVIVLNFKGRKRR